MTERELLAGIDAGGTTFKCVVADRERNIVARKIVPTAKPDDTMQQCVSFFAEYKTQLSALGIGSFGPLDTDPTSRTYGTILKTPKPDWSMTPIKETFEQKLQIPVSIDTDVNAALRAESVSGAAKGARSAAYITVGTGIGAGISIDGIILSNPKHPEFGHIAVRRHPLDSDFEGICPFHAECLEGLASAAAFEARYGDARSLPMNHIGWRIEANYLAQACMSLVTTLRLEKVILGGGLMQATNLISLVRTEFIDLNADYLPFAKSEVSALISLPEHGADAGIRGAIELSEVIR